jgi:hypothetical protein
MLVWLLGLAPLAGSARAVEPITDAVRFPAPGRHIAAAESVYPTDAELERLAFSFHQLGKSEIEHFGPWTVQYLNCQTADGPSQLVFGVCAPWRVQLSWNDGENSPPHWSRDECNPK